MNTNFYQTTEFYQQVAIVTVLIVLFALILGPRLQSKRRRLTIAAPVGHWTAQEYYMYVTAVINTSFTIDQLNSAQRIIDRFCSREFHPAASQKELQRYHARLLATIDKKRKELQGEMTAAMN